MRVKEILNLYDVTDVRVGYVKTNNLSNELDSLTVILTNISKISIESDDIVEFTDENSNKSYWLVGNVNKSYTTFKSPYLYEYTVDLISLTKLLEKPIPSQSISYRETTNRSLKDYISRTFLRYFSLKGRYSGISFGVSSSSDFPSTLLENYNSGHAPDSTFEKPLLREYLDYLFNFIGYISQLKLVKSSDSYVLGSYTLYLTGFNLNPTGSSINTDYVVEITEQQQGENYITCLEQNMDEVIAPTPIVEHVRIKAEEAVFNEKNARIITRLKIYDVQEFLLKLKASDTGVNDFYVSGVGLKYVSCTSSPQLSVPGGNLKFYLGKDTSNITISYATYYEYCLIDYDGKLHRYIHNSANIDSNFNDYTYKRIVYNWTGSAWTETSTSYTNAAPILANYAIILVRNYNHVGSTSGTNDCDDFLFVKEAVIDLLPYLKIKPIYDSLTIYGAGNVINKGFNTICKNNSFYWERGSNTINNLLDYESKASVFGTQINDSMAVKYAVSFAAVNFAIGLVIDEVINSYQYAVYDAQDSVARTYSTYYGKPTNLNMASISFSQNATNYKGVSKWNFYIKYIPYANLKIRCEKENKRHLITSMDSNTNICTDVLSEIKKSKEKVKQLANPNLILNAFATGTTQVMNVGDTIVLDGDTYTLISLEAKHDISSIIYKGILSKNYSNFVINTIINREKRYYSLPDNSESIIRHEKIEFDVPSVNNSTGFNLKCNTAIIKARRGVEVTSGIYVWYYAVLPVTQVFSEDNKKLTYTLDLGSNSIYGYKSTDDTVTGGVAVGMYKYTDDFGETDDFSILLCYRENESADDLTYDSVTNGYSNSVLEGLTTQFSSRLFQMNFNSSNNFLKDAREHLIISVDLNIDDSILQNVKTALEAEYGGTYDKFTINN